MQVCERENVLAREQAIVEGRSCICIFTGDNNGLTYPARILLCLVLAKNVCLPGFLCVWQQTVADLWLKLISCSILGNRYR